MPQQTKITRQLDLDKRAEIVGLRVVSKSDNYAVTNTADSGSWLICNNSGGPVEFTLPAAASCNGQFYNFYNANSGVMKIVSANTIVCALGLTVFALNYGAAPTNGQSCMLFSDGAKFMHIPGTCTSNGAELPFVLG